MRRAEPMRIRAGRHGPVGPQPHHRDQQDAKPHKHKGPTTRVIDPLGKFGGPCKIRTCDQRIKSRKNALTSEPPRDSRRPRVRHQTL